MWYVYFLKLSNGHVYVGSSNNVDRRLKDHQDGLVQATKGLRPVKLEAFVAVKTEKKARELEKYFKSGSGKAIALKRFL